MNTDHVEKAFHHAFSEAVRKLGFEALKRTSLFGSNEMISELKKAA